MLPALRTLLDGDEGDVHVVASGDPLLHGVGGTLIRLYGPDRVAVLPHVSSVTLACSRVGWAVQDTEVISLVTAEPHTAVRRGGQAVVMSRDGATPATLARLLTDTGRGDSEITVLEQLGGPAERQRSAMAREWAARPPGDVDALNVIAVRYLPDDRQLAVLSDDSFAHDGQITKQSMRAVTLAALAPRPGELLWDVGAGSGSVAIEWCRSGSGCWAVAFERDEQRRKRIADNAVAFGVRVEVQADAPACIRVRAATVGDLRRRWPHPAGATRRLSRAPRRRRAAGRQRGDRGIRSRSRPVVFTSRRRAAAVPALPRGAAGRIHRLAARDAGHAVVGDQAMTVYFIGAGPGAADLITVRGQRLLNRCPVCLYAGSIMPDDLLAMCPPDARVVDTGPLTLDQIITELADAHAAGLDVARLHSGDPSIYSALAEQCRRLNDLGIDYEIVPGVPAFAAAAAVLGPRAHGSRCCADGDLDTGGDVVERDARRGGPTDAVRGGRHAGAAPCRRAD